MGFYIYSSLFPLFPPATDLDHGERNGVSSLVNAAEVSTGIFLRR
jgi:hypothetical protein